MRKGNKKKRIKDFRSRCFQIFAGVIIVSILAPISYYVVGPDIIRLYEIGTSGESRLG